MKVFKIILIFLIILLICTPLVYSITTVVLKLTNKGETAPTDTEEHVENEKPTEEEKLEMSILEDGTVTVKGKNTSEQDVVYCVLTQELTKGAYRFESNLATTENYYFISESVDISNIFEADSNETHIVNLLIKAGTSIDVSFITKFVECTSFDVLVNKVELAKEKTTVSYSENVFFATPLSIRKNLTLDLSGKKINASFNLEDGATLNIFGNYSGVEVSGNGTLILTNVVSKSLDEGISGLTVKEGSNINIRIVGSVRLVGGIGGDGIRVPKNSSVVISGETLTVIGNSGAENSNVEGYSTTVDPSYEGKSGSGIGYARNPIGFIHILDMESLIAYGYGRHAFGIGGNECEKIVIENSVIESAKGGFAHSEFISDLKYGKSDEEGGCAIGVGHTTSDAGVIQIKNSTIKSATGGSKSAGIGALYWSPVIIEISNSTLEGIQGGNSSAGIGGSRVNNSVPSTQICSIKILDSNITATGGTYGAGIGNGYDVNCSSTPAPCNIEILGDSTIAAFGGKYGAGIGTGFHTGNLTGYIEESVTVTAVCGVENVYKDTYTTAQDVGYGVCDPIRDMLNETVTFKMNGEIIANPVEEIGTENGAE